MNGDGDDDMPHGSQAHSTFVNALKGDGGDGMQDGQFVKAYQTLIRRKRHDATIANRSPHDSQARSTRIGALDEDGDEEVSDGPIVTNAPSGQPLDASRRKHIMGHSPQVSQARSTRYDAIDGDGDDMSGGLQENSSIEDTDASLLMQAEKLTSEALHQLRNDEVEKAVVSIKSAASLEYPNWDRIKLHLPLIENVKNSLHLIWASLVNSADRLQDANKNGWTQEQSKQHLSNLRTIDTKIRLTAMQLSSHQDVMKFDIIEALKDSNLNKDVVSFARKEFVYKPAQNEASKIIFQPGGAKESGEAIEFVKAIRKIHKKYIDVPNEEMILIAKARLHGSAVQWASGCKATTLDEWVKEFTTTYVRPHEINDYYKKFTTLRMSPSDDVQKFIEKFDEDANILSSLNFLRPTDENVVAFQFAQGLPMRLKEEVSKHLKIQFVQHAPLQDQKAAAQKVWEEDSRVRAAVSEELSQGSSQRLNAVGALRNTLTPKQQSKRYGSIFTTQEAVTMKAYLELNSPGEHRRRLDAGLCYICSSPNHPASYCDDKRVRERLDIMNDPQKQQKEAITSEPTSAQRGSWQPKHLNKRRRLNHTSPVFTKKEEPSTAATGADSSSEQGNE